MCVPQHEDWEEQWLMQNAAMEAGEQMWSAALHLVEACALYLGRLGRVRDLNSAANSLRRRRKSTDAGAFEMPGPLAGTTKSPAECHPWYRASRQEMELLRGLWLLGGQKQ